MVLAVLCLADCGIPGVANCLVTTRFKEAAVGIACAKRDVDAVPGVVEASIGSTDAKLLLYASESSTSSPFNELSK
jgi:hypothetical protein